MATIAIDFDGTCVDHRYPEVGPPAPMAVEVMQQLVASGHKLILYTMRSGDGLEDAKKWFAENSIELYGIQYDPEQATWTTSNKCHADICIDDRNLGCPVRMVPEFQSPVVDWSLVPALIEIHSQIYGKI